MVKLASAGDVRDMGLIPGSGIGQKLLVLFQMYRFILNAFILSVELFFLFKLSINFIVTLFKIFNIREGRFGFSIGKTA